MHCFSKQVVWHICKIVNYKFTCMFKTSEAKEEGPCIYDPLYTLIICLLKSIHVNVQHYNPFIHFFNFKPPSSDTNPSLVVKSYHCYHFIKIQYTRIMLFRIAYSLLFLYMQGYYAFLNTPLVFPSGNASK